MKDKIILTVFGSISVLLALYLFYPVVRSLISYWQNHDQYSHGFIIAPVSLYIIWLKCNELNDIPNMLNWPGLCLTIFSLMLFTIAYYAEIQTIKFISFILFIYAVVIYFTGLLVFKSLTFPMVYLLFMLPLPSGIYSQITVFLQLFVTKISVWATQSIGVPIYRSGNLIHLPDLTLQVVDACSGIRSIISLIALSAVFGYLALDRNILRITLFISGLPIAIFVNILRILITILSLHYLGIDLSHENVHMAFGIFTFSISLIILFTLKLLLQPWDTNYKNAS